MRKINQRFKRGGIGKATVNPMVRGWKKTKESRKEWEREDFEKELANAQIIDATDQVRLIAAGVLVTLSKGTLLDKSELVGRRLDEEAKRCLELLIARFDQPKESMVNAAIGYMCNPAKQKWRAATEVGPRIST